MSKAKSFAIILSMLLIIGFVLGLSNWAENNLVSEKKTTIVPTSEQEKKIPENGIYYLSAQGGKIGALYSLNENVYYVAFPRNGFDIDTHRANLSPATCCSPEYYNLTDNLYIVWGTQVQYDTKWSYSEEDSSFMMNSIKYTINHVIKLVPTTTNTKKIFDNAQSQRISSQNFVFAENNSEIDIFNQRFSSKVRNYMVFLDLSFDLQLNSVNMLEEPIYYNYWNIVSSENFPYHYLDETGIKQGSINADYIIKYKNDYNGYEYENTMDCYFKYTSDIRNQRLVFITCKNLIITGSQEYDSETEKWFYPSGNGGSTNIWVTYGNRFLADYYGESGYSVNEYVRIRANECLGN